MRVMFSLQPLLTQKNLHSSGLYIDLELLTAGDVVASVHPI